MPLPDTAERLGAKNLPSRTHARTRYINIINYFLVAEKRAGRAGERQGREDRQREGGEEREGRRRGRETQAEPNMFTIRSCNPYTSILPSHTVLYKITTNKISSWN